MAGSDWGSLFGQLVQAGIKEAVAVVKAEVEPLIEGVKQELKERAEQEALAGTETVTQVENAPPAPSPKMSPSGKPVEVAVRPVGSPLSDAPVRAHVSPFVPLDTWHLKSLEALGGVSVEWWTEPPFSQDEKSPLRWLPLMVARCINNWQDAINALPLPELDKPEDEVPHTEPMTPHEGAFALGVVFAEYVHKAGKGNAMMAIDCAVALKRWFDQGVTFYEQQRKAQEPAGPLSGAAPVKMSPATEMDMRDRERWIREQLDYYDRGGR